MLEAVTIVPRRPVAHAPGARFAPCRLGLVTVAIAATAGCAMTPSSHTQMTSRVSTSKPIPVSRVMVFANLKRNNYFNDVHYQAFAEGFAEALKPCGTTVEFMHDDRLDLDQNRSFTDGIRRLRADSVLVVYNAGGGQITRNSERNGQVDLNIEARLNTMLRTSPAPTPNSSAPNSSASNPSTSNPSTPNPSAPKTVELWRAQAKLWYGGPNSFTNGAGGRDLGTKLADRLRQDGMIAGCPTARAADPPAR